MNSNILDLGDYEETRDGVPLKYKIITIPPHLVEPVIKHMSEAFLPRERMFSHFKTHENPILLKAAQELMRGMITKGAAVVALREGPEDEKDRIVGANINYVSTLSDLTPECVKGTEVEILYEAVTDISKRAKIYETYKAQKYLASFGLSVDPKYHGYKIGERLLQSRKPICEKLGIKVTSTVFSHPASMYLAKKVGFVVLYEEDFDKYEYKGVQIFKGEPGKFEQSAWYFGK